MTIVIMDEHIKSIIKKTAALILQRADVSESRAERLAVEVINGIVSHGLNPENWDTVVETVNVLVAYWIENGYLQ